MHEFISFNNRITPAADARIFAVSPAALYGRGVFTTIAVHDGKPFLWPRHWARLQDNAARIGFDISGFAEEDVLKALGDLVERNRFALGLARVTFFDEAPGKLWPSDTGQGASILITTRYPRPLPERLKLTVSPYRINSASPIAGVKSCNYLENLLAIEEAKARGFDEAIRLNERGEIASGCMANIFWRTGGMLYTPSLKSGCVTGTTRGEVIEKQGAVEMDVGIEVLENADAIILTSAGLGKVEVGEFDGRAF